MKRLHIREQIEEKQKSLGHVWIKAATSNEKGVEIWGHDDRKYQVIPATAYSSLRKDWYDKNLPLTISRLVELGATVYEL